MCDNNTCPSRKSCYRYTATPNEYRQTYSLFEVKEDSNKCESYISNKEYEHKRVKRNNKRPS